MSDLKNFLARLNEHLNILREREAKYAGNIPLELLNQIDDYKKAIDLVEQTLTGEFDEAELKDALKPLLLAVNFYPSHQSALFINIPPKPNNFVGRETFLTEIVDQFLSGDMHDLAIHGMGGAGKTTLAVEIAYDQRIRTHFRDGVLWARLGPSPDVLSELGYWAESLKIPVTEYVTEQARFEAIKNAIGQDHYLLIIDDVWPDNHNSSHNLGRWFRCGGPNCCHLLTTRFESLAYDFSNTAKLIPTLSPQAAFELLKKLAPRVGESDHNLAYKLIQAVGYLPLAVELLGGYLRPKSRFKVLLQEAIVSIGQPTERLNLVTERLGSGKEFSLAEVIELNLSHLPKETKQAFYALGAFAAKPTTFSLEAALAVTKADELTISELIDCHLVEYLTDDLIAIHQTIADVARQALPATAIDNHRTYYLNKVSKNREDWHTIETIYPQIKYAWKNAPQDESRLDLIWAAQTYQERRGLWQDFLAWAEVGLNFAEAEDKVKLLNEMARVHNNFGDYRQALPYLNQALAIGGGISNRKEIARTLDLKGGVHLNLGDIQQTLACEQQALSIYEDIGDRRKVADTLISISWTYFYLSDLKQALTFCQRALVAYEENDLYGEMAYSLTRIAELHTALGKHQQALVHLQSADDILKKVDDYLKQADTFINISKVYLTLDRRQQAISYLERAASITNSINSTEKLASIFENIGGVYKDLGHYKQAIDYYNRALPINEEIGHLDKIAITFSLIGDAFNISGNYQKALAYLQRSLSIYQQSDEKNAIAWILSKIAETYYEMGEYQNALDYYQLTLPIYQELDFEYWCSVTRSKMAAIYREQGDLTEATAHLRQAVETLQILEYPPYVEQRNQEQLASWQAELAEMEDTLSSI